MYNNGLLVSIEMIIIVAIDYAFLLLEKKTLLCECIIYAQKKKRCASGLKYNANILQRVLRCSVCARSKRIITMRKRIQLRETRLCPTQSAMLDHV